MDITKLFLSKAEGVFENGRYGEIVNLIRKGLPLYCKKRDPNKKIEEYIIYGTNSCEFINVSIKDGKIVDPEEYFKRLSTFDHGLGLKIESSIFREMIERAIFKALGGKLHIAIRTAIKLFIAHPEDKATYNMGWHYDYYGGKTIAMELFNDIDPKGIGRLSLARNIHPGKRRPFRPGNTEDVIIDPCSVIDVEYIKNGLIIFDNSKGKIVHRPEISLDTSLYTEERHTRSNLQTYRILLQIVIRDEW